jgi:hypothetical protein
MVVLRWAIPNIDHTEHILALDQPGPGAAGEDWRCVIADACIADASNATILPAGPTNIHLAGLLLQCSVCCRFNYLGFISFGFGAALSK